MAPRGAGLITVPISALAQRLARMGVKLFESPSDTIRGLDGANWPSPLQPRQPIGLPGTEPKAFEFWEGQNLISTARVDAEFTAAELKDMAAYPLARICIENVKDTVSKVPFEIQAIRKPDESKKDLQSRTKGDDNLRKLNKFFERPDREHDWTEWLRPLLEDLLVIDAPTVLIRKTFAGQIVELPVLRGESIVRYIDANGFTPMAPSPAYAQNWWGLPLVNLTTDQLVYKPRNIVPRNTLASQLYGMSPIEQLATEIKIGLKRLEFTLNYYTEGSIPGVVQVIPPGIPPDKISEAQNLMNSQNAGNLAARRQWSMVQGFQEMGHADQILLTKEPLLADQFDDLHIRKIAFGIGTSAQRLLKMMNRASSQSNQDAAEEEGTLCYLSWLTSFVNYIIQMKFGFPDYEIVFDTTTEPDPEKQMAVVTGYTGKGVMTINEGREKLGEEPRSEPEANELGVIGPTGFVPLGQAKIMAQAQLDNDKQKADAATEAAKHPAVVAPNSSGTGGKGGNAGAAKPNGKKPPAATGKAAGNGSGTGLTGSEWAHCGNHAAFVSTCDECSTVIRKQFEEEKEEELAKAARPRIQPGRLHPTSILAKHKLEKSLNERFGAMDRKCVKLLEKAAHRKTGKLAKAGGRDETLKAILKSLRAEWRALGDEAQAPLESAAVTGAGEGSVQLNISDEGLLGKVNQVAKDWAGKRAAELVGMKREDGVLIENPNAKWAISDTTRDELRDVISKVFAQEAPSMEDIEQQIRSAGTFSEDRAAMIARTEITRAQVQGNLDTWKASGLVKTVNWKMSANHDQDDLCLVGSTMVSTGPFSKAFSRLYSGEFIDVELSSGNKLTGTPNHPVLTDKGWKPLEQLREGDNLVSGEWLKRMPLLTKYFDQVETSLKDKVGSFAASSTSVTRPSSGRDFHGDGIGSHVHVVSANQALQNQSIHARGKKFVKTLLGYGAELSAFSSRQRNLFVRLGEALQPLFCGGPAPQCAFCLAVSAQSISSPLESLTNTGGTDSINSTNHLARELLAKIKGGHIFGGDIPAPLYLPVRKVAKRFGVEHVYNLSTESGFYIANNIVTRNCDENELNGPYLLDEVPEFPAHPSCVCALVIAQVEE